MAQTKVVILGAGVIGLSTAVLLSKDPNYSVTVIAKHMPGDYDIEYASPWAGANYLPTGAPGTPLQQFERDTWPHFYKLAKKLPEAGVHFQNNVLYARRKDVSGTISKWQGNLWSSTPWFADVVPDFRTLPQADLPPGTDSATAFTSVCINTAIYLPWLTSQALKLGATVRRGTVSHISDAASLHASGSKADIVINCTGMGSRVLKGVEDMTVGPARGQIVLVRNDPGVMASTSGTDDAADETVYIMHRAVGGGTILGGCYQKGAWESQPDPSMAVRIMQRAVEICPALVDRKETDKFEQTKGKEGGVAGLSIVRHSVGLRPVRDGGPRVENETVEGQKVVHAYGHGGGGYQSSWGTAEEVVRLVGQAIGSGEKARL